MLLADELARWATARSRARIASRCSSRLQLPMSSELTRATMIRVAELIGASEVVFGDVRLGDELTVRARMISSRHRPGAAGRVRPRAARPTSSRCSTARWPIGWRRAPADWARRGAAADAHRRSRRSRTTSRAWWRPTPAAQQRFLESALAQAPRDGRVLTALWSVYTAQGLHDKSARRRERVPAESPRGERARFDVALSLIELRRLDGAVKELHGAARAERSRPCSRTRSAIVELRRGADAAAGTAASFFARATTEDPGNTDYLVQSRLRAGARGRHRGRAVVAARGRAVRRGRRRRAPRDERRARVDRTSGRGAARTGSGATLLGTSVETSCRPRRAQGAAGARAARTELDRRALARLDAAIGSPAQRDQQETAEFHLDAGRRLVEERRDREPMSELQRAIYLAPYAGRAAPAARALYERAGRLPEAVDEFKVALWCRETAGGTARAGRGAARDRRRDAARREVERALVLDPDRRRARALAAQNRR